MKLFVTIVLDGVGIGAQPDACNYGDDGADTLGHVVEATNPDLPNLERLGLGRIRTIPGLNATDKPLASWGKMMEVSAGKDSTTGHWELAGLFLKEPFPVYPNGFPREVIDDFLQATGCRDVLGNRAASGTDIIQECDLEHRQTGYPIVYTSADSVFQIAAHVDVIPLGELYRLCQVARAEVCVGGHRVGRVIARPYAGDAGSLTRLSDKRKDFARLPDGLTLQEALQRHGVRTVSVGKVADLFGGIGFDESIKTRGNADGMERTLEAIRNAQSLEMGGKPAATFIWVNLIDFDQEFGHRNDASGFAGALEAFDKEVPTLLDALPRGARLVLTADHGNDPTTAGSDHSREYVPLLYYGAGSTVDLGIRDTFADHAATVAAFFGAPFLVEATSFEQQPSP